MKILITGAHGMLGQDVVAVLRAAGHQVTATDLPEVDITDPASCARAVAGHDVVINTAAYTAVDAAETNEGLAFTINAVADCAPGGLRADQGIRRVGGAGRMSGLADRPHGLALWAWWTELREDDGGPSVPAGDPLGRR